MSKNFCSLRGRVFTVVLCLALLSLVFSVGVANATTNSWSLSNWDITNVWSGKTVSGLTENFTGTVSFGGVKLNNASAVGCKFSFAFLDSAEKGWGFEVFPTNDVLSGYLARSNTVTFVWIDNGTQNLLATFTACNASSVSVRCDSEKIELYINGVKQYQDTAGTFGLTVFRYWTDDVYEYGSITHPSCFTGSFSAAVSAYSSSGVSAQVDSSAINDMTSTLTILLVSLMPLMVYVAIFKLIPRLLKGLKF